MWKSLCTFDEPETESRWRGRDASGGIADAARFAERALQFEPDSRQRELLECDAKQVMLNCTRQWGKSTVTAIKAVHRAHSFADGLVVASPTERQSEEFLMKARHFMKRLGVPVPGDSHHRAEFAVSEWVEDCGVAGKRRHNSGIFAGFVVNYRRGGAGFG